MSGSGNGAERRVAPRVKTFQPAELTDPSGERHRVHLLNLSVGGALVYGRTPPDIGTQVQFHSSFVFGAARVTWRSERCFGVQFDCELPNSRLAAIMRAQDELVRRTSTRLRERASA